MKSLSTKISLGYFFIISINIAIAVFAIYHINRLGNPVERVLKEKYQNVSAAENMIQALNQQNLQLTAMLADGLDSSLIINFNTYKNEFYNWHQKAIEGISTPRETVILDSIMTNFHIYLNQCTGFWMILKREKNNNPAGTAFKRSIAQSILRVKELSYRLKSINESAIADADRKARQYSSHASLIIVAISVIAFILSVLASFRFTRSILRPLRKTTETVRKIGQGQLNQKIDIMSNDEIAELGREFNKMTGRLAAYEKININKIVREKKKSEAIVAGIPVAIIVTDEDMRLSLMNDLAMKTLDITAEDWQGKTVPEVVKDQRLAKILAEDKQAATSSADSQKTLISIKRGEEELFFFLRRIKIADHDGQVSGVVTLLQDITSFKNLDRMKSEFMATISHEFKTPLTSINMIVDILLRGVRGEMKEEQRELLLDAKIDCERLRSLVTDLLDLSKLESGKSPVNFKPVKIENLLEYALHPLQLSISEKRISLQTEIYCPDSIVEVDFHHLSRVLTNLVENAVQHTPEAGKIDIEVTKTNGKLRVCVADSGPGIPDEAIDFIFDKFVQVKNFKDSSTGNIGLGLAISKEIIKAHNGEIWVESQPDRGSRFYFDVPVKQTTEIMD